MCNSLLYCGDCPECQSRSEKMLATAPRPTGNPLDEYPGTNIPSSSTGMNDESGFKLFGVELGGGGDKSNVVYDASGNIGSIDDQFKAADLAKS